MWAPTDTNFINVIFLGKTCIPDEYMYQSVSMQVSIYLYISKPAIIIKSYPYKPSLLVLGAC